MMLNRHRHKQAPKVVEVEKSPSQSTEKESIDFSNLTKKQIKEELDTRDIEYNGRDSKGNLLELLRDRI